MRLSALLAPEAEWTEADLPIGCQEPTHSLVPPAQFTHGHDAVALAEICGYRLYEFQREGLIAKLGANMVQRRDGAFVERWAAGETADIISRRNGKSVEIEVLILAGLFVLGERLIMYTAHRDDTAEVVFNHVVAAIKRVPELWAELVDKGPRYTNGQRRIELKSGAVCYFRTRTEDTARGQGYDRLILDESQALTDAQMAALLPLMTGSENGQLNYAGSAGGQRATVMAKVWRSFEASERSLCYRGWHADPEDDFDDLDLIARVNPRLGSGLSYGWIAKEFGRMTRAEFGQERCGAARYPREDGAKWVIPQEAWEHAKDETSAIADDARPELVLEADPDLEYGSICVAGRRPDRAIHVEVIAHNPGVEWIIERAFELQADHDADVWIDPAGPLAFMLGDLRRRGVRVRLFRASDVKASAAWMYAAATPKPDPDDPGAPLPDAKVRHRGPGVLTRALAAAETRKLLGQWAWRRQVASGVNQGPLVGCSLAAWAVVRASRAQTPPPPSQAATGRPSRATASTGTADLADADF